MRSLAAVFKALSDETRLSMLGLLFSEGELCVCDFVQVLDVTQSKASRHLRYLVNAGLLQDRRDAVWVYFRIHENPETLQKSVLDSLKDVLNGQVTSDLLDSLANWRNQKCCNEATCKSTA